MFSIKKDKLQGFPDYVNLIENKFNFTEKEATKYVFNEVEKLCFELKNTYKNFLKESKSEESRKYLIALMDIVVGTLEWSKQTSRYKELEHKSVELEQRDLIAEIEQIVID